MKIALYKNSTLEFPGGYEKYIIDLAAKFSQTPDLTIDIITLDEKLNRRLGYLMQIYFFRGGYNKNQAEADKKTAQIRKILGKATYFKLGSIEEVRSKLSEYDVIYTKNELIEALVLKFFLGYKRLPPIIFGCHTPFWYPEASSLPSKLHNSLYGGPVYKFLASGVSKFHAINSTQDTFLRRRFPGKEVIKIPNPFDFKAFREAGNSDPYEGVGSDTFNIVWAGRLTEQKGVKDLEKIINDLNSNNKNFLRDIAWHIAGEGQERPRVEHLASEWPNVFYHGLVPAKRMSGLYAKSNLMISTSKWEGFPYNLLEAAAHNLPMIAYNIAGCDEIIQNNDNGYLVDSLKAFEERIYQMATGRDTLEHKTNLEDTYQEHRIYDQVLRMFQNAK